MMRRKNLERAVILGLLLSTSVYGSAWAREDTTPIQKPDLNEIIEEGDWKITTDKSALAYNGLVDIKKGDLIIIANGAGSNGIEAGYMEDEPAKLQIYANDINIPNGVTNLLDLIKEANVELRKKDKDLNVLKEDFYAITKISYILGLHFIPSKLSDDDLSIYKEYLLAKENKDFAKSDELRKTLIEKNIL